MCPDTSRQFKGVSSWNSRTLVYFKVVWSRGSKKCKELSFCFISLLCLPPYLFIHKVSTLCCFECSSRGDWSVIFFPSVADRKVIFLPHNNDQEFLGSPNWVRSYANDPPGECGHVHWFQASSPPPGI